MRLWVIETRKLKSREWKILRVEYYEDTARRICKNISSIPNSYVNRVREYKPVSSRGTNPRSSLRPKVG